MNSRESIEKMDINIFKIGGNVINSERGLDLFLDDFSKTGGYKILVHSGGKIATDISKRLGIEVTMITGKRVTDAEILKVVTMVYAGLVNKTIVANLVVRQCLALGVCGADFNLVPSSIKPEEDGVDYGYVGLIKKNEVNSDFLLNCLKQKIVPVFSSILHDEKGTLLNVNDILDPSAGTIITS